MKAAENDHFEICKVLISAGADVTLFLLFKRHDRIDEGC
jgi:hypothetical protein